MLRASDEGSTARGTSALLTAVAVTVVSGGLASLLVGDFPGITWFLVRLLLTVPFLLWWWAWAGRDRTAAVVGGIVLAFLWTTYSQFLGPVGLPDTPLRILDASPPPATVEWLDYRQLWLVSFPLYLVTMVGVLLVESGRGSTTVRPAAAVVALARVLFLAGATSEQTLDQEGAIASLSASGNVQIETGTFYSVTFGPGNGDISVEAEDMGSRVTPLPPHDLLTITASISADGADVAISVEEPMVNHPLGEHTTWWGVGLDVAHHGQSGIGTDQLAPITSELAAFGLGTVTVDGEVIATGVPVHVMTAESGLPGGARLELDVGMIGREIPGLAEGHLRVLWPDYEARIDDPHPLRYLIGGSILVVLVATMLALLRRESAS